MHKKYLYILIIVLSCFISFEGFSQENNFSNNTAVKQNIEGLSIYPNPVANGKTFIYITSKNNFNKKVEFFNVLGKRIFSTIITGKELNISKLNKGVYVLKITENNISATRKLVIK